MMSVFKVHQALALCNDFDKKGLSLDTLVKINREKLDPKTWSPIMYRKIRRLRSVRQSDNKLQKHGISD